MPSFVPKTDSELAAERLLPKGEYDFDIIKAENKTSKTSGAPMIVLTVGVYPGDSDRQQWVTDNLVFVEKAMFKVSQFAKAVGLEAAYRAGNIDAQDCVGRAGRCKVDIEPEGEYPAKNKITSYVIPKATPEGVRPPHMPSGTIAPNSGNPLNRPVGDKDDCPF